jgi:hypothetical protein
MLHLSLAVLIPSQGSKVKQDNIIRGDTGEKRHSEDNIVNKQNWAMNINTLRLREEIVVNVSSVGINSNLGTIDVRRFH